MLPILPLSLYISGIFAAERSQPQAVPPQFPNTTQKSCVNRRDGTRHIMYTISIQDMYVNIENVCM